MTCLSNSAHWQKVTLTWGATTITFEGVGAGVPMKLADGATVYPLAPSQQNYFIEVLFQHSLTGAGGPFRNSVPEGPIAIPNAHTTHLLVTADDSIEHVNNNAMLMINYESEAKLKRTPAPEVLAYAEH
jgi:hypothetical protein